MSGPGAGFEYPPYEVTWLKRDVLLFANSIGCTADELHFLFVILPIQAPNAPAKTNQELHPNFAVFPTYPIILRAPSTPLHMLRKTTNPSSQHSKSPRKK